MTRPLVLLAVADDPVAHAIHAALLAHEPPLTVETRKAPADVVEFCATANVDLLVLSDRIDATAGAALLQEIAAFAQPPQTIVLFDDPLDPRRGTLARAGLWECVLGKKGLEPELQPIMGLVDRLLLSDARDARLDAADRQFRAIVESSNDAIYIIRDSRFVYANRRFLEMIGFSRDELASSEFAIDRITAPESRAYLHARRRRVEAGAPVEPRYEFVALRHNGERFDASVSVSYIEFEGRPGALGIMQDITERKRFELQLVRKNRELALLNALAASVNQALALDDTLLEGCRHILSILGAEAAGITLLGPDRRTLELRVSEGLADPIIRALADVPLDAPTLLARAVRSGEIDVVADLAGDPRITIEALRETSFGGAIVVPLKARAGQQGEGEVVGAAFALLARGQTLMDDDRELMGSIGNLLGNAVEKTLLLEAEKHAVQKLVALDEIALSLSSTLDVEEVASTVTRSVHRLFGAMRVMIARLERTGNVGANEAALGLDRSAAFLVPVFVLDDGEPQRVTLPVAAVDTIMGLCLDERRPVQRVRPAAQGELSIDPLDGRPVEVLPYEADLFRQGVGTGVAIPIMIDGAPAGALWVGYTSTNPLSEADLHVLLAIGNHVAIATKNAALFEGRNQALEHLRAAQDKLVESEKLNAIGLIAHGVAHDFNNVLGSILGRAQLLRAQLHDPALIKHAEIIEKAAADGAETVRRIQEIGRSEQDQVDAFIPIDATAIVEDVLELTRPKWEARSVDVATVGSPGAQLKGNASELREVLINLVHNAVDAMPPLGGTVRLSVEASGDRCLIRVTDTGTGIPPALLSRIFDPYFTTKGDHGTGLGLSVSQSIVRRHGGELKVTSRTSGADRGTTFTLDLPALAAGAAIRNASLPPLPSSAAHPAGRARILIVDDEENIREILSEMLLIGEHEVVMAADGAEALHKLRTDPSIDLVFTDLGLPGLNGYEVAQEIKKIRPDLLVGLVTGWGATLDPDKARSQGVDMVISKPFRFEQVLGLVDEALQQKQRAGLPACASID